MNVFAKYKDGERIKREDLVGLTDQQLLELRALINEDILYIGNQILASKQRCAMTGVFDDADWYRKITFAKKIKGQLCQTIQNELHRRREERRESPERLSEQDAFIRAILKVMDDLLLPAQKKEIVARAKVIQQKIMAGEPY